MSAKHFCELIRCVCVAAALPTLSITSSRIRAIASCFGIDQIGSRCACLATPATRLEWSVLGRSAAAKMECRTPATGSGFAATGLPALRLPSSLHPARPASTPKEGYDMGVCNDFETMTEHDNKIEREARMKGIMQTIVGVALAAVLGLASWIGGQMIDLQATIRSSVEENKLVLQRVEDILRDQDDDIDQLRSRVSAVEQAVMRSRARMDSMEQ